MSRRETPPTIIGVMPPGVRFLPSPVASQEPNYNVNALGRFLDARRAEPGEAQSSRSGNVVARLQSGRDASNRRRPSCVRSPPGEAQADRDFDGIDAAGRSR